MFAGKNILVTGAAGFIGVNLLNRLLQTDAAVIRGTLHAHDAVLTDPRIEYVRGDLTTAEACAKACADILGLLLKLDGFEHAQITYDASKPTMIPKRLIDPTKASRLLGYSRPQRRSRKACAAPSHGTGAH